jgi:hypothetical protein
MLSVGLGPNPVRINPISGNLGQLFGNSGEDAAAIKIIIRVGGGLDHVCCCGN